MATRSLIKEETTSGSHERSTYEEIMGIKSSGEASEKIGGGGVEALSKRLMDFRKWCTDEAKIKIHPSICIVNGEATDGTKNAPVLVFAPPPGSLKSTSATTKSGLGRVGMVDGVADRALYEKTMGCQIWTAREIKQDEVMMTCPKSAMITPDLVATSDAGRAVLACCRRIDGAESTNFWDVFENSTICEEKYGQKTAMNKGEQLLINTLRDRTKAERAFTKATKTTNESQNSTHDLATFGNISTRAPVLAFLIHQRFSPNASPPVKTAEANPDFEKIRMEDKDSNALFHIPEVQPLAEMPFSFGPYARTLPSSVSLPICWERNELSLLSSCIPGVQPLQEIATTTMQLVAEFIALINAGILTRFPSIFSPGMITWERWVWAYSCFTSRMLPASTFLNDGEEKAEGHSPSNGEKPLYSPAHIWNELGVLIPFLDMVNHEVEAHAVLWQQNRPSTNEMKQENSEDCAHPPRAIISKKVKKQQQVFFSYGLDSFSNTKMMLSYGFAQMLNPADAASIGWGLMDSIGYVQSPADYVTMVKDSEEDKQYLVYESNDTKAINEWWSDERLTLLEKEAFSGAGNSFMSSLKMGNKMKATARSDGIYDPILLTATLVSSMPVPEILKLNSKDKSSKDEKSSIEISMRHQRVLRSYLLFFFSRKLEKLLDNLSKGLKNHYGSLNLWTKASDGGVRYVANKDIQTDEDFHTGWQSFFDQNAYAATMEVENHYYSLAPESCVLTLIDGHLQSLQHSIDNLLTWEKFENGVLKQLDDLGFHVTSIDEGLSIRETSPNESVRGNEKDSRNQRKNSDGVKKEEGKSLPKKKSRNRKRNSSSNNSVSVGDRPTAIKLHIGNLSYTTTPSDLFDFFSRDYGRDNILECHIPAERATGKSRGFGFVTLPESCARQILTSGRKCEINGRILKVAESNSAGSNKPNRHPEAQPTVSNDRCDACGYRPKYCVCQAGPSVQGQGSNMTSYGPDHSDREYDYGRDRHRQGRHSRSVSPYSKRSSRSEKDDYYRDYSRERDRRYYDYDYDRSRSRSHSRGRERRHSRRDRKDRSGRDRSYEKPRERYVLLDILLLLLSSFPAPVDSFNLNYSVQYSFIICLLVLIIFPCMLCYVLC